MTWRLADAKNRFSEVVRLALMHGPQRVQRHSEAVIILSERDYKRLTGDHYSFKDYLMEGPSFEDLDITCHKSLESDDNL